MKYRLIDAEKDHHAVSLLARVLGVSRQGYYAWAKRGPSARARRDAELTEKIRRHHTASDEVYGAPRIHADLREIDGEQVGRKRVARLMRAAGLAGVSRRKGCRTTIADRRAVAASDLVKRTSRTGSGRPTSRTCRPGKVSSICMFCGIRAKRTIPCRTRILWTAT
ncbi:IS3 family transposase [Streptosporangium sp. NPDC087985]|uniref:IS3 family transposase n=1 Tax=Streptosporangium sp. NPDC087985 TaxID=3366196 RepID=UPI00382FD9BB